MFGFKKNIAFILGNFSDRLDYLEGRLSLLERTVDKLIIENDKAKIKAIASKPRAKKQVAPKAIPADAIDNYDVEARNYVIRTKTAKKKPE